MKVHQYGFSIMVTVKNKFVLFSRMAPLKTVKNTTSSSEGRHLTYEKWE